MKKKKFIVTFDEVVMVTKKVVMEVEAQSGDVFGYFDWTLRNTKVLNQTVHPPHAEQLMGTYLSNVEEAN